MTDSEHDTPGRGLNYTLDDLDAVLTLLDACENYPSVYEAVVAEMGPLKREFTVIAIPTIRAAMHQEQAGSMAALDEFDQWPSESELDLPRLLGHVSDDAKWIAGLIVNSRITYSNQMGHYSWGRPKITKIIGEERVKNGLKELKAVLKGGLS